MMFPSRENQDSWVTLERTRDHFGAFNPKANTVVLDGRERGLRNPGALGKLILTKALQLADDANGFANRHVYAILCGTKLTHYDLR
jgi:hypothetical protein